MLKSYSKFFVFGCFLAFITACSPKLQIAGINKQLLPISDNLPKDSTIMAFYKPYKLKLDSMMNVVVGFSEKEIKKEQPEGPLNNFFADAMFDSAKDKGIAFDFVYTNYGGLRVPIPQGKIYRYKIFELMPFENIFVTVKLKADDIQRLFDYMAESGGESISGANFTIENKKATDISINDEPLKNDKTYTVLTSDYMANGGEGGGIFSKGLERKDFNFKLRDGILQYLDKLNKAGKTLNPVKDGRVKIK